MSMWWDFDAQPHAAEGIWGWWGDVEVNGVTGPVAFVWMVIFLTE